MPPSLLSSFPADLPPPFDQAAVARFWQDLPDPQRQAFQGARPLMDAIAGGSPYLREIILRAPDHAVALLGNDPDEALARLLESIGRHRQIADRSAFMAAIRHAKRDAALLIGCADLAGRWDVIQVTRALTLVADAILQEALNWLLLEARRAGRMTLADPDNPSLACGYVVLAMGKHGAFELNYSSDIDLIVLYDPETASLAPATEPATFFVKLTRNLVALLQDVTSDGYAFRTDLRLRPDPRATQIAISIEAAAVYYENMGQNWERAAMIKARPAAGDIALGQEFLARLRPYVWRKYLDFAAIADVQSLKRQIHAVKGHGEIAVEGHNLKLGRGGIREIEFFVQTQQLIAGGRNPKLRGPRTLEMLEALAEAQWITPGAAHELKEAYLFLRRIEHRVQMVEDEQTHVLPQAGEKFESLSRFSGFATSQEFAARLRATFETVQGHYAALFEDAPELATDAGSLVFTGGEDDAETIETLSRMGFRQPSEVSATIRGWHFGRYAATRSSKSKELLTELMPALLTSLARSGEADRAFVAFDRFLSGLPAGVQLFSMLKANPNLLDLICTILGTAPRLADQLSRRPSVLDAVLDPGFFGPMPKAAEFAAQAAQAIAPDAPLEEAIDRARIVGREQMFRVGVRILSETASAEEAGGAFSAIAESLIGILHQAVERQMIRAHGKLPGGASAILAMGKLGGREMTAGSDLDLILIYDHARDADMSDGPKPLGANQYYARLTQRLVTALSSPTSEGVLYDVDLRLRPSGSQGPVAASLDSFKSYHADSSWTWEKLALTRARVVHGTPELKQELGHIISTVLCMPRDPEATLADVRDMRRLMIREKGTGNVWDIKQALGGLVEVEFIAQTLQLLHAHRVPSVLDTKSFAVLARLQAASILGPAEGAVLREACSLYHRLTQVLRLCVTEAYDPAQAPAGLNRLVASAAATPDIAGAECLLAETQARVAAIFEEMIGR
jgi:glutamate-ammonia-ligase adenylyltransferase